MAGELPGVRVEPLTGRRFYVFEVPAPEGAVSPAARGQDYAVELLVASAMIDDMEADADMKRQLLDMLTGRALAIYSKVDAEIRARTLRVRVIAREPSSGI